MIELPTPCAACAALFEAVCALTVHRHIVSCRARGEPVSLVQAEGVLLATRRYRGLRGRQDLLALGFIVDPGARCSVEPLSEQLKLQAEATVAQQQAQVLVRFLELSVARLTATELEQLAVRHRTFP